MTKKAIFVKPCKDVSMYVTFAEIYKLDPPFEDCKHVRVSSAVLPITGTETMIFLCDPEGNVVDWMDKVVIDELDHHVALAEIGYTIETES